LTTLRCPAGAAVGVEPVHHVVELAAEPPRRNGDANAGWKAALGLGGPSALPRMRVISGAAALPAISVVTRSPNRFGNIFDSSHFQVSTCSRCCCTQRIVRPAIRTNAVGIGEFDQLVGHQLIRGISPAHVLLRKGRRGRLISTDPE